MLVSELSAGRDGVFQVLPEDRFRNVSHELDSLIDDGHWNAAHAVSIGEVREFADFDDVGDNVQVSDCHLVGQPGHIRTVGSGRCNEHLDVDILVQFA